jgi:hypothetical protein
LFWFFRGVPLSSPEELSSAFTESALSGNEFQRILAGAQQLTGTWPKQSSQQSADLVQSVVARVVVQESAVEIELAVEKLAARLCGDEECATTNNSLGAPSHVVRLTCPLQLSHRRGELRLVLPNATLAAQHPNHSLVRSIARSLQWKERIIAGEVYCKEQLAAEANMNASYVGRILRLGALSPDIVDWAIRDHGVSENSLTRRFTELPFDWSNQRNALRMLAKEVAVSGTRLGLEPVTSTV